MPYKDINTTNLQGLWNDLGHIPEKRRVLLLVLYMVRQPCGKGWQLVAYVAHPENDTYHQKWDRCVCIDIWKERTHAPLISCVHSFLKIFLFPWSAFHLYFMHTYVSCASFLNPRKEFTRWNKTKVPSTESDWLYYGKAALNSRDVCNFCIAM